MREIYAIMESAISTAEEMLEIDISEVENVIKEVKNEP